jgi:hypothetical protein
MKKYKYLVCFFAAMLWMYAGIAQTYRTGDKVQALISNTWKDVTIVKVPTGNGTVYQVAEPDAKTGRGQKIILTVNAQNIRMAKAPAVVSNSVIPAPAVEISSLHLGRYELYSGVPTMYLGHFILLANGKYKVAFDTDETNYDETGSYVFDNNTMVINWVSGMFKNNNWGGKLVKNETGYRIEFTKTTYADSK